MKTCPMPNCRFYIQDRMLACKRHWMMIPDDDKEELAKAFNLYLKEEISHAEFSATQERVLSKLRFGCQTPRKAVSARVCVCGVTIFVADSSRGKLVLEECQDGFIVIVAYNAEPGHGRSGAYTRFALHAPRCVAAAATEEQHEARKKQTTRSRT